MAVSIVMPVYQNIHLTVQAVENLLPTYYPHELIVVDNGSDDGTAQYLDTKPITVIRNPTNIGIGPAVAQGFAIATGEYLALTCNDMLVHPANYGRVVEAFEANPNIWCATCKFTNLAMPLDWWDQAHGMANSPVEWRVIGPPMPPHPPIDQMMGGWLVFSREGWETLGGYDPVLPDWYADADIWCRCRAAGHPVVQVNVLIHHYESQTTRLIEQMPGINLSATYNAQAVFEAKWGSVQSVIDEYTANPCL